MLISPELITEPSQGLAAYRDALSCHIDAFAPGSSLTAVEQARRLPTLVAQTNNDEGKLLLPTTLGGFISGDPVCAIATPHFIQLRGATGDNFNYRENAFDFDLVYEKYPYFIYEEFIRLLSYTTARADCRLEVYKNHPGAILYDRRLHLLRLLNEGKSPQESYRGAFEHFVSQALPGTSLSAIEGRSRVPFIAAELDREDSLIHLSDRLRTFSSTALQQEVIGGISVSFTPTRVALSVAYDTGEIYLLENLLDFDIGSGVFFAGTPQSADGHIPQPIREDLVYHLIGLMRGVVERLNCRVTIRQNTHIDFFK